MIKKKSTLLLLCVLFACQKEPVKTLAEKVSGVYIGEYKYKETLPDFLIRVEPVSANTVRIHAEGSNRSADFTVEITPDKLGNRDLMKMQFPLSVFQSTGYFVLNTGQISYNLYLGSSDPGNKEIFNGTKKAESRQN